MRIVRIAQATPPGAARLKPTSDQPNEKAAASAKPTPTPIRLRFPSVPGSSDAAMTPITASPTPIPCSVDGRSPRPSPYATGTIAAVAVIGPTIPIVPIASAL